MCGVCFLFFFLSLFSRVFLACQLINWWFQSIVRQLICCCFMSFQIAFINVNNQLYRHFYIVLILIKRIHLFEDIKPNYWKIDWNLKNNWRTKTLSFWKASLAFVISNFFEFIELKLKSGFHRFDLSQTPKSYQDLDNL